MYLNRLAEDYIKRQKRKTELDAERAKKRPGENTEELTNLNTRMMVLGYLMGLVMKERKG